jgi:hypothetical protein
MAFSIAKKAGWRVGAVALVVAAWLVGTGCQSGPGHAGAAAISTPAELVTAQARAAELKGPLFVLVAESGHSREDDEARAALESRSVRDASGTALTAVMDLSMSRTRATVARFHALETPLLVCLSPRGVIISRDQKPITESLILERLRQAAEAWPELDAKLTRLEAAAREKNKGVGAQMELADFLIKRHNAFEAIPILSAVAYSETADTGSRIRAWTALARAHFWVAEPEKGRHEAQNLIATLGAATPEARAAGNLAMGAQDATNAKRSARARQEFEEAISVAPDSTYGKQAAEALAKLAKGGPAQ